MSASDALATLKDDDNSSPTLIEKEAARALGNSAVAETINYINDNLDRLVNVVSSLSEKLSPLTDPSINSEPEKDPGPVNRPNISAVAMQLYIINERVAGQVRYLQDLYERTDI